MVRSSRERQRGVGRGRERSRRPTWGMGGVRRPFLRVGRGREDLTKGRKGSGATLKAGRSSKALKKCREGSGSPPGGPSGVGRHSWRARRVGWPSHSAGRGRKALLEGQRGWEAHTKGQEGTHALLKGWEGSGGHPGCPGGPSGCLEWVGRPSQRARRDQKAPPEGWEGLEVLQEGREGLGGPPNQCCSSKRIAQPFKILPSLPGGCRIHSRPSG